MYRPIAILAAVSLASSPGPALLAADESCVHLQAGCPIDFDMPGHERPSEPVGRFSGVVSSTGNVSSDSPIGNQLLEGELSFAGNLAVLRTIK